MCQPKPDDDDYFYTRSEWEDEQRRKDEPENMLADAEFAFRQLVDAGFEDAARAKWEEIGIALRWLERMKVATEW